MSKRRHKNREEKRRQFTAQPQRRGTVAGWLAVIALVAGLVGYTGYVLKQSVKGSSNATSAMPQTPATLVSATTGQIQIPAKQLETGKAAFFEHKSSDGWSIRFFALRGSDGGYRLALDACEICFHSQMGYYQRGDEMVCRKCGQTFPSAMINKASGGCHPITVPRTVQGDNLLVQVQDLEAIHSNHAARGAAAR